MRGEGREVPRPGAAPRGVQVQAGGEGGRGTRLGVVARPRRLAERRFKQAATAGGGPAGRSGAAPRGAKAQIGSDGKGRGGAGLLTRARRLAERRFKRAAKAAGDRLVGWARRLTERRSRRAATAGVGAGRRPRPGAAPRGAGVRAGRPPGPTGGLIPVCPVRSGGRAGAGAPCAPPRHPDYIYQRVVGPEALAASSLVTQSGQGGALWEGKSGIPPPRRPCPGSGPLPSDFPGGPNSRSLARAGRSGALGPCSGPGCAPGNHRGALAVCRAPHSAITLRIHPGRGGAMVSGVAGLGARGDAGTANPPSRPAPPRLCPLCRTRPTSRSPSRLRCPLEPSPCGAPRPGDRLRHALTAAVAAGMSLRSVGCRAGPTGRSLSRRRCLLEPSLRGVPRRTDRPVPLPAFAARLDLRSVGRRARPTGFLLPSGVRCCNRRWKPPGSAGPATSRSSGEARESGEGPADADPSLLCSAPRPLGAGRRALSPACRPRRPAPGSGRSRPAGPGWWRSRPSPRSARGPGWAGSSW